MSPQVYFEREISPYQPDAWVNESIRDYLDGEVGKVGYEINFVRTFYRYQSLRSLEEIDADIQAIMGECAELFRSLFGNLED
jgi:type I restriction enzyme M protein